MKQLRNMKVPCSGRYVEVLFSGGKSVLWASQYFKLLLWCAQSTVEAGGLLTPVNIHLKKFRILGRQKLCAS